MFRHLLNCWKAAALPYELYFTTFEGLGNRLNGWPFTGVQFQRRQLRQ
jgi:hypothetical protein